MGTEEPKVLGFVDQPWPPERMISPEENGTLCLSFLREDLGQCLSDTKTNTAPGSDDFPVAFFKKYWPILKEMVLHIANGFVLGTVDISQLNFGILSLIPKINDAESIK